MNIFVQLSLIIVLATLVASIMRLFKQPLVVGYILTGLLLTPFLLQYPQAAHTLETFSELGVAILLFIVGLHLSPYEVKSFGKGAVKVGILQILVTSGLGFLLSRVLGYPIISSMYLAAAVTFSSTIIVLKTLTDRQELEKLYGRIAIGVLLLQDLVAALLLIWIASSANGNTGAGSFLLPFVYGSLLTAALIFISLKVLPKVFDFFAKSKELLFLFSLAWGFGLATLFHFLGLSIEIGALIAGIALSLSPYSIEISSKLKPLRDFFVVMFFILIGSHVVISDLVKLWLPLLVLTVFVLLLKPLIIMLAMGFAGRYKKKTSFMGAISLAQISEFSLIVALLGAKVGHIGEEVLSLITLLAVISIAASTYYMMFSEKLYSRLSKYLKFIQRKKAVTASDLFTEYDVILFGCHRAGYDFIEVFKHLGQKLLCVDFDPDLVKKLTESGINCRYGDAEDGEFLEEIGISSPKMVVSTISEFEANEFLLSQIADKSKVAIVLLAQNVGHALTLYERGADYVILPHFIGGRLVAEMAEEAGFDHKRFGRHKKEHVKYLEQRRDLGHS
jgi:Kef-type K+ transport system membrane component KefB